MVVGADIGGHHVAAAVVDPHAPQLISGTYRHVSVDPGASRDVLIAGWAQAIGEVIQSSSGPAVEGVGIAMPGPFDYRTGVGYFETNGKFQSLYGVDVKAALEAALGNNLQVRFLNDAAAFAVGCVAMGDAGNAGRVLAITLGTGLGSAFLDDGVPVVEGDGVPEHGCLWHLRYLDSIADDYVSARWLLRAAGERAGGRYGTVAAIADAARSGDAAATEIFAIYGQNLGTIVAPWVAKFGVDEIVLGGRIAGAFDLFEGGLKSSLAIAGTSVPVAIHNNTEDAAIIGGAMTFNPEFWGRVSRNLPRR